MFSYQAAFLGKPNVKLVPLKIFHAMLSKFLNSKSSNYIFNILKPV